MMLTMFFAGFLVGGIFSTIVMACLMAAGQADERSEIK